MNSPSVSPQILDEFLQPFITAATISMLEWGKTEIFVRDVTHRIFTHPFGELSALLRLKSAQEDSFVLGFHRSTATALAKRVFSGVLEQPDQSMVEDALGELGNVIAGQAKALLAGTPYQFSISTPTIIAGMGAELERLRGKDSYAILFGSELGDFALQILVN